MSGVNLYRVEWDSHSYYVEAPTFGQAVAAWITNRVSAWKADGEYEPGDETREPDSVELIHDTNARVLVWGAK